jgi:hypothetical protein
MIFEFLACGLGGVAPFSWSFGRAWEEAAAVGGWSPTGATVHGRIVLRKKTIPWPLDRFDYYLKWMLKIHPCVFLLGPISSIHYMFDLLTFF